MVKSVKVVWLIGFFQNQSLSNDISEFLEPPHELPNECTFIQRIVRSLNFRLVLKAHSLIGRIRFDTLSDWSKLAVPSSGPSFIFTSYELQPKSFITLEIGQVITKIRISDKGFLFWCILWFFGHILFLFDDIRSTWQRALHYSA